MNASADLRHSKTDLATLIRTEGRLRVLRALIASVLVARPRPRVLRAGDLPDYLLRDIGIRPDSLPRGPRHGPIR